MHLRRQTTLGYIGQRSIVLLGQRRGKIPGNSHLHIVVVRNSRRGIVEHARAKIAIENERITGLRIVDASTGAIMFSWKEG